MRRGQAFRNGDWEFFRELGRLRLGASGKQRPLSDFDYLEPLIIDFWQRRPRHGFSVRELGPITQRRLGNRMLFTYLAERDIGRPEVPGELRRRSIPNLVIQLGT